MVIDFGNKKTAKWLLLLFRSSYQYFNFVFPTINILILNELNINSKRIKYKKLKLNLNMKKHTRTNSKQLPTSSSNLFS
jgi:hypothetical protein